MVSSSLFQNVKGKIKYVHVGAFGRWNMCISVNSISCIMLVVSLVEC